MTYPYITTYQPQPDIRLEPFGDDRRGWLLVGEYRRWPAVEIEPVALDFGLERSWRCAVPFENGAVVEIWASDRIDRSEHGFPSVDREWVVSLADGLGPVDAEGSRGLACLEGTGWVQLGCFDRFEAAWVLDRWEIHHDPEAWWLNEWLGRVGRARSPQPVDKSGGKPPLRIS